MIGISQSTCDDLVRLFGTSQEKISIVHLGCDPVSQAEIPSTPELPSADRPYLLYVRERSGYKNFFGMLKSVAKWPAQPANRQAPSAIAHLNRLLERAERIRQRHPKDKNKLYALHAQVEIIHRGKYAYNLTRMRSLGAIRPLGAT